MERNNEKSAITSASSTQKSQQITSIAWPNVLIPTSISCFQLSPAEIHPCMVFSCIIPNIFTNKSLCCIIPNTFTLVNKSLYLLAVLLYFFVKTHTHTQKPVCHHGSLVQVYWIEPSCSLHELYTAPGYKSRPLHPQTTITTLIMIPKVAITRFTL